MKMAQIYSLVNDITKEVMGDEAITVNEDLSNIVDVGKELLTAIDVDQYVKVLVNHVGRVVFVNRVYGGSAPSVLMDAWEYGSVMEKISTELPDAEESDSWKLTDGADYSPNTFHQPTVEVKFFNSRVTFEIPISFTEMQVKQSFSNANQLGAFINMITVSVENSMTVKLDGLIMRTINNMIGEVIADHEDTPSIRVVELLSAYNTATGESLTSDAALSDPNFIRFATYQIGLYSDRLTCISTLFNVGGKQRFTPRDMQHLVLLSDFSKASTTFLASETYNAELVALPRHETVPFWQGSGLTYDFDDVSKISVKTATKEEITQDGIVGVLFDRDALGVSNLDRRVTTNYNPKAEFYTNFYKFDAGFFNDLNENFVVFVL